MKAVIYEKYGPPEVLELKEVEKPRPKDNEILVKIYSTTVTAGDWRMRSASPFLVRLFNGLFKPTKTKTLGFELAGVVEEVGRNVTSFVPGDEVFADCGFKFGAYAEFKCLPDNDAIVLKPTNMTFDEAAAVPVGGLTAYRLLKIAGVAPGQEVLVYGASGSVGTFAVQLAKYFGARVTAVCSGANAELVKSLGADRVIDYKKEDVSKSSTTYDIVIDAVGMTSTSALKKLLRPAGKLGSVKSASIKKGSNDLQALKEIIEARGMKSVIDRTYTLETIREAHTYVQQFRKKGNVVVKIVG